MTGVAAGPRLRWAAIGAGLVLAGCGASASPPAGRSHAGSSHGPAHGSVPNASAVRPESTQRCSEVYCVPLAVPRGAANGAAPSAPAVRPNGSQWCAEVYCVPQPVRRIRATLTGTG